MLLPPHTEPRICGYSAVKVSFLLLLITSVGSIIQQIAFTDCDSALAIPVQWTSFISTFVGMVAFYMAICDHNEQLMRFVILLTFYGILQSILVALIAFFTITGSDTCISRQIRSWDTACFESQSCYFFSNHVEFVNGGMNGVIVEYSILLGVFSAVLTILYISEIFSYFTLLKSFREFKKSTAIVDASKSKLKQ
ncbi:hypothetical protein PRIPAC_77910 [Pristionchus pacificus]|uniref:Uncharacterized protein n=1 Tax=Pristionchus pacificus TaxID=54126 RepID=A0A2A6CNY2_PRIPA|nr:hypothetical protein PRIPAC_77910 [Pristionchus pacificus]|eukprot:PDM79763.1 hypothetical protein PRIPAC_32342 [Pristionchus pacificus]